MTDEQFEKLLAATKPGNGNGNVTIKPNNTLVSMTAALGLALVGISGAFWVSSIEQRVDGVAAAVKDLTILIREGGQDRFTRRDALTLCLAEEAVNSHIGWKCAHPDAGAYFAHSDRVQRRAPTS